MKYNLWHSQCRMDVVGMELLALQCTTRVAKVLQLQHVHYQLTIIKEIVNQIRYSNQNKLKISIILKKPNSTQHLIICIAILAKDTNRVWTSIVQPITNLY